MEDTAGSLRMWLGPPSVDNPRRCESSRPFHTHFGHASGDGRPSVVMRRMFWDSLVVVGAQTEPSLGRVSRLLGVTES